LSGEHPARSGWRYLTVFQFRMCAGSSTIAASGDRGAPSEVFCSFDMRHLERPDSAARNRSGTTGFAWLPSDIPRVRLLVATGGPNLAAHLGMAPACRIGAGTTIPADRRDHPMRGMRHLSMIRPIFATCAAAERYRSDMGFAAPLRLSADIAYWDDPSHFTPAVAHNDA